MKEFGNFFSKKLIWRKKCLFIFPHWYHGVELRKFTLTLFWEKFRESNAFTKQITKELIWRKKISVRVYFSFFHTVDMESTEFRQKFREINFFTNLILEKIWQAGKFSMGNKLGKLVSRKNCKKVKSNFWILIWRKICVEPCIAVHCCLRNQRIIFT